MFHTQVPVSDELDAIEFFSTLEECEDYCEGVLKYSLPEEDGFFIWKGTELVCTVARNPWNNEVFAYRESNFDSY